MGISRGSDAEMVRACSVSELDSVTGKVVRAGGRSVLILMNDGVPYALDNRCPHMGFPLHRGTLRDGILTCHWHHAKFDVASGCTFDPFADDVAMFRTEIRDDEVWLDPSPIEKERLPHWSRKLEDGLEQDIRLVLAKSAIGLHELGAGDDVIRRAVLFGVRNRAAGWSMGLTILTCLANVLPDLNADDRPLALYQGVTQIATSTSGQPPRFELRPMETTNRDPLVYLEWFRRFVEVRSPAAAERCLRTAIDIGLDPGEIADMIFAACTDHLYLDTGHTLDFANKAFELLDHIGWQHAGDVLTSLVPAITGAQRMEETSSWTHPVDLSTLLTDSYSGLDSALGRPRNTTGSWPDREQLAETILGDDPDQTLQQLLHALNSGAPLMELSATVAYAAARRLVHFHTSNEVGDWHTVHHTFTYANAVDQAIRRAPSRYLARAIFDGAMSVYLDRFLNVPKAPIPPGDSGGATDADILARFDTQQNVNETAALVASALKDGRHEAVIRLLGRAMLREDSEFHQFQMFEAAVRQYRNFQGSELGDHVLIGASRFLTAFSPTIRSTSQTFEIAARLNRGEALHENEI